MTGETQPEPGTRKNRPRGRYEPVFAVLEHHPGRWALLATDETISNVVRLREEKVPLEFELMTRDVSKSGRVGRLYARYNPASGMPRIREVEWEDPPPVDRTRRKK